METKRLILAIAAVSTSDDMLLQAQVGPFSGLDWQLLINVTTCCV